MISVLLGQFARKASPFSRVRFAGFMVGLAAVAALSIAREQTAARLDASPAGGESVTIVRFAQPAADVHGDLRHVGLPWFLRRQGATAEVRSRDSLTVDVDVIWKGTLVGSFVDRVIDLDADRSKLFVAFFPRDPKLVAELAAPIETKLDPLTLMRVVMAEHIRSSVAYDTFDMKVLSETPGSRGSIFRKAFFDHGRCLDPQRDDFAELCTNIKRDANIRRAYREEDMHVARR